MANLFKKAKEAASSTGKVKAKEKKVRVRVNLPGFFEKVKRQALILEQIKTLTAESELNADEIKEIGKENWAKIFEEKGVNPESIIIEAKESDDTNSDTAQYMLLMSDKYITIDQEQANFLKETFGDGVINENEKYEFNKEMVEKYGEILSDLINTCDQIPDNDKGLIINAVTKNEIAKGTIDKFANLAKDKKMSVNEIVNIFKPVCSAKGVEYIQATPVY